MLRVAGRRARAAGGAPGAWSAWGGAAAGETKTGKEEKRAAADPGAVARPSREAVARTAPPLDQAVVAWKLPCWGGDRGFAAGGASSEPNEHPSSAQLDPLSRIDEANSILRVRTTCALGLQRLFLLAWL